MITHLVNYNDPVNLPWAALNGFVGRHEVSVCWQKSEIDTGVSDVFISKIQLFKPISYEVFDEKLRNSQGRNLSDFDTERLFPPTSLENIQGSPFQSLS